ncbi:glycolate oxidase iron-sulfur subunit [Thioalkalivibrio denitrificans]|uniref:Glycolate oxidase iron-sulfur subunit n=1 Tax=Thioalkalivibrio denitrificans TaxID=108003 RepID=A0A1V3NJG0_9GAMM|nr:glycolate oxidase subunit GlcF [Thioalkalivibrio denitrificans]OOG25195.1 glycolate oxidase iron-sulfur subunit [Thioalkalivibrio denitrificans]
METHLAPSVRDTAQGREAERILRTCVHCGFCNATCPTYQLRGDELDGPRGRIYLIKQVLEGTEPTRTTQRHLDRCLTCLNCMTTCPSGVDYRHLVDIGRNQVNRRVRRPVLERIERALLRAVLPYRRRFAAALNIGRWFRPVLPSRLADKMPADTGPAGPWPDARHERRMLVLAGCVQGVLTPNVDAAAARILDRLGISLQRAADGCCGAVEHHLDAEEAARQRARHNIDAWWPEIQAGAEAILVTASGCGVHVRDYGHLLRADPAYSDKAAAIVERVRDPCEVIDAEAVKRLGVNAAGRPVAFHPPCTLQHGMRLREAAEAALQAAGLRLTPVRDAHLCCGAAGTYALLQPELSTQLRDRKVQTLEEGTPEVIVTSNVGCQTHLSGHAGVPVLHWLELLDELLQASPRS